MHLQVRFRNCIRVVRLVQFDLITVSCNTASIGYVERLRLKWKPVVSASDKVSLA